VWVDDGVPSGPDEPYYATGNAATDSYTLLHFKAGFQIVAKAGVVGLDLTIRNLLDEEYTDFLYPYKGFGVPNPGRDVRLIARFRFQVVGFTGAENTTRRPQSMHLSSFLTNERTQLSAKPQHSRNHAVLRVLRGSRITHSGNPDFRQLLSVSYAHYRRRWSHVPNRRRCNFGQRRHETDGHLASVSV
jgi:hypothetical protein